MLPKLSGIEVLKRLRSRKIDTPVLMLSAKSEVPDKIAGLDTGADDYLTKPFASAELAARVRALARRKGEFTGDLLEYAGLKLDKNTFYLSTESGAIKLGVKEYGIMEILLSAPGHIVPKERIIEKVWGYDFDGEYNTVEVYISFLRKKLQAVSSKADIRAMRGRGYSLEVRA
jgi:DNA-binding response OmpR family regulator